MRIAFKNDFLKKHGLPKIDYPVPIASFEQVLANNKDIKTTDLLFWLQGYSSTIKNGWEALEAAMLILCQKIAPKDENPNINIHTPDFFINVQQRDLSLGLISIMRQDQVLAIIRPMPDFTIGITVFHPLDSKSICYLMGISQHPHPKYGVGMNKNNWEFAIHLASNEPASIQGQQKGESYFLPWGKGLGVPHSGEIDPALKGYYGKKPLMPNIVATQIGTYYERMDQEMFHKVFNQE